MWRWSLLKTIALWVIAVLIAAASAFWQRVSGPTYPVSGAVVLAGQQIHYRLARSQGDGDQPVRIEVKDPEVTGEVAWRRYPTDDPWRLLTLARQGDALAAALPHQPPAGKLEYQVRLRRGGEGAVFPERAAVTRFKGDVPAVLLIPHIILVFAGMLLSTKAGIDALVGRRTRWLVLAALVVLVVGGLILGPAVQKMAFDAWWTGWPNGHDLTDDKMAVAVLAWAFAAIRLRKNGYSRAAVLAAAALTLIVFAIPHSTWGSELKWDQLPEGS